MVKEDGSDELLLVNKNYDWRNAPEWLRNKIRDLIKDTPDYQKVTPEAMSQTVLNFLAPSPDRDTLIYGQAAGYAHAALCRLIGTRQALPVDLPAQSFQMSVHASSCYLSTASSTSMTG